MYEYALRGFTAKLTPEQLILVKNHPLVEYVEQDFMFKGYESEIVVFEKKILQSQSIPWGITRVGGAQSGIGKKAWIIDGGVDLDHPDLNVDLDNSVSYVATESADDLDGHGTHVAGILAAKDNGIGVVGVAAGATVVSVKVLDQNGNGTISDAIDGVNYVAGKASNSDVINMSLSSGVSTSFDNSVINAANSGKRFVLAAGNQTMSANNRSPARVEHPNVWTISGYDINDNWYVNSNFGNPPIEYGGPGVGILSLDKNGGTTTKNGTSMAAPHIAGLLLTVPNNISIDGNVSGDPDGNADGIAAYLPFSATVTGPSFVNHGDSNTWTAVPENGSGGYSYQWYYKDDLSDPWTSTGTNSSTYSHTFFNNSGAIKSVGIRVDITSGGETETGTIFPTVSPGGEGCGPHVVLC